MSAVAERADGLELHLKGLALARALSELRGATPADLEVFDRETNRVRAELARARGAACV